MKFDHEKIEEKLRKFWRENKKKMHYFLNGKEVFPTTIYPCSFQLKEIASIDGYNFEVTALSMNVLIDSHELPYKADFLIKVVPEAMSENKLPEEKIVGILNNRITLRK